MKFLQQVAKPLLKALKTANPSSYTQGLTPYRNKQWQVAQTLFERAIVENPQHAPSHFKLGMCFFRQKNYEQAKQHIEHALQIAPEQEDWQQQLNQTLQHLSKKSPSATHTTEEQLISELEKDANNPELYNQLAQLLRKQGKWWQEVEALKSAIALKDNNANWHYRLGEALEVMNRFQEAARTYGRAIELKKNKADAQWYYRQGYCFERKGHDGASNPTAAQKAYQQAIQKDTKLEAKRFGIGVFHQARGHWSQAVAAYKKQLLINPIDAQLHYRLGMAHDRCYEWALAETCYKSALALDKKQPYWHYRLGFVLERQEEFEQAALAYQYATLNREKHTPYWFYRWGYVLEQQGQYQAATEAYLQTSQQPTLDKPVEPELVIAAELTEESVEEVKAGKLEEQFEGEEITIAPSTEIAEQKKPIELYEEQFLSQQLLIEQLNKILEEDTTSAEVWYKLGNAYEREENWQAAAEAYQHALDRQNDHSPELFYRLGFVLRKVDQHQQACEAFRQVRVLQKPYGVPDDKFIKDEKFRLQSTYTEYYESLSIVENVVLYESFHGSLMSCNPYALFQYMIKSPGFSDWKHVWAINDLSKVPAKFKKQKNIVFVRRESDAYLRYLASAKFLINNTSFHYYFIRKQQQFYLNTWHGTPWKFLGKQDKSTFFGRANIARNFLHCTHIIAPNKHTLDVILNDYQIKDLYAGKIALTGYPRIDATINANKEEKQGVLSRLGVDDGKKVVLYSPTWRGGDGQVVDNLSHIESDIKSILDLDVALLFRSHYFVQNSLPAGLKNVHILPDDITTNEVLPVVDVLVTDYSSVMFDYMVLDRPIVYYTYDYEDYKQTRGLYFDVDELGGYKASNQTELIRSIKKALSVSGLPRFDSLANEFVAYEDGMVSERVVDWFINGVDLPDESNTKAKKPTAMIYAGSLMPNGITTSLKNLLENTSNAISFHLLIEPNHIISDEGRLEQYELVSHHPMIGRVGATNYDIEEFWLNLKYRVMHSLPYNMLSRLEQLYKREWKRLLGESKIDYAINFDGYNRFWSMLYAFTPEEITKNIIYLHNDMIGEWREKFPSEESVFNLYPKYDQLISVSKSTNEINKKQLVKLFNVDREKFDYVDNLLNPQYVIDSASKPINVFEHQKLLDSASPLFINMARLSIEKGHENLIKAFHKSQQFLPSTAKLIILGDGPLRGKLQRLINDLELRNHVFLLGRISNPFPYLKQSDCFVFSSLHEGQGLVLLESMILQKLIICTDFPCAHDVLHNGKYGKIVENSLHGLVNGFEEYTKGTIDTKCFDSELYQKHAIEMFYKKVCGLGEANA